MAGKRKFVPESIKVILTLASLAGSIGIWNNLAQKELVNAAQSDLDPLGLSLPPIPTLVELAAIDGSVPQVQNVPQETVVLRSVDMPVVTSPTQAAQGNVTILNAPVTRTRPS